MATRRPLLRSLLISPGLLFAAALPVHAASFDCKKASSAVEQAICASDTLSQQDQQLAEHYQQLMALTPRPEQLALRNAQRDWLKQRNNCATANTSVPAGTTVSNGTSAGSGANAAGRANAGNGTNTAGSTNASNSTNTAGSTNASNSTNTAGSTNASNSTNTAGSTNTGNSTVTGSDAGSRAVAGHTAPAPLDACLAQQLSERDTALTRQLQQALAAADAAVALIPRDPAAAARQLRALSSLQSAAWLVYLQQFEPASGVTRQEAEQAQKQVDNTLAREDDFAWSVLRDSRKDPKTTPAAAALLLLRMSLERDPYATNDPSGKVRADQHCFVFSRQGDAAYEAFGPLYGSTRDSFAPICPPQGGLFEKAAWKTLDNQFDAPEEAVTPGAGTIRFASFTAWRILALRATLTPKDFLKTDEDQPADDGAQRIKDWTDEKVWPAEQRQQAVAAIDPAIAATAKWLQQERGFSAADARTAASNIVQQWLTEHLDYLSDNSDSE